MRLRNSLVQNMLWIHHCLLAGAWSVYGIKMDPWNLLVKAVLLFGMDTIGTVNLMWSMKKYTQTFVTELLEDRKRMMGDGVGRQGTVLCPNRQRHRTVPCLCIVISEGYI